MKRVTVGGVKCEVLEDMGDLRGYRELWVKTPEGEERAAVRDRGYWRFWGEEDRVTPLEVVRRKGM